MSAVRLLFSCIGPLIGCGWQLWFISAQYFRYPMVTRVEIIDAPNTPRASLSLEFDSYDFNEYLASKIDMNAPSTTQADLFDHLIPLASITFPTVDGQFGYNVTKLLGRRLQVTVDFEQNSSYSSTRDVRIAIDPDALAKQFFMPIVAHKFDSLIYDDRFEGGDYLETMVTLEQDVILDDKGNTTVYRVPLIKVEYDQYNINYLKHPYETSCVDYATINYKSRLQCLNQCQLEYVIKVFNYSGHATLYFDDQRHAMRLPRLTQLKRRADFPPPDQFQKLRNQFDAIYEYCQSKCSRQDCRQEKFVIVRTLHQLHNFLTIIYRKSHRPVLVTNYEGQFTTVDYVVYVLSTVSFWLGISPLPLLESAIEKASNKLSNARPGSHANYVRVMRHVRSTRQEMKEMRLQLSQVITRDRSLIRVSGKISQHR